MQTEQAYAALKEAAGRGVRLGLSRMEQLMHLLGDPQDAVPAVHIAGTNGKGSVGAMLASILRQAGYCTGHFSSPGLYGMKSCLRMNGEEVSGEQFGSAVLKAAAPAQQLKDKPTGYELLTAAAFTLFREAHCDIAMIECCMGGDTDCTNVIARPLLSIITNVQKDHCAFLGDTPAEIASHKAGIIKTGCPVLADFAANAEEANAVIRAHAKALGAPLHLVRSRQFLREVQDSLAGIDFIYDDPMYGAYPVHLPLAGAYQLQNVQTVLRAVEILRQTITIPSDAVRRGLAECIWQGRFEVLQREPAVIFDGAHNPAGMQLAAESLGRYFGGQKAILLIGAMADKDCKAFADILKPHISRVFAVRPDEPRAMGAAELAALFRDAGLPAEAFPSVETGVRAAYAAAQAAQVPLAAMGSLYLYRAFREVLDGLADPGETGHTTENGTGRT